MPNIFLYYNHIERPNVNVIDEFFATYNQNHDKQIVRIAGMPDLQGNSYTQHERKRRIAFTGADRLICFVHNQSDRDYRDWIALCNEYNDNRIVVIFISRDEIRPKPNDPPKNVSFYGKVKSNNDSELVRYIARITD